MDPEQTAPRSSLIWVHTVCQRGFLDISADKKSRRLFVAIGTLRVKQINVPSSLCFWMVCDYAISWSYLLAVWAILDTAAQTNLMEKRELIALLCLSSWCLVIVVWLFLTIPPVSLQFVIVEFPDHTN